MVVFILQFPTVSVPVVHRYKRPSSSCDLAEYTSNDHLDMFENVAIWDYPIFELERKAGNHILSHVRKYFT